MACKVYLLCTILYICLAILKFTNAVKVDMHGSIDLGKDVVEAISAYLGRPLINARRIMTNDEISIETRVHKFGLCRGLKFCRSKHSAFINEYVISLAGSVQEILALGLQNKTDKVLRITVQDELKSTLRDIRAVLVHEDKKSHRKSESSTWLRVVKQTAATFLTNALTFVVDSQDIKEMFQNDITPKLSHNLVICISEIEAKYLKKLCTEYNYCLKSAKCTSGLVVLLEKLVVLPDKEIKSFLMALLRALPDTYFYTRLSEMGKKFQKILEDMVNTNRIQNKEILMSIKNVVETGLKDMDAEDNLGNDVKLIRAILSDMDYFYRKESRNPSHIFLNHFYEWTLSGGKILSSVKDLTRSLENVIQRQPESLVVKLIFEVRVFLELTLGTT